MKHAKPGEVSEQAKKRQPNEVGTLGSGNHYLELQKVVEIYDGYATRAFGPGHPDLPEALKPIGQPVLIGGTMGTAS